MNRRGFAIDADDAMAVCRDRAKKHGVVAIPPPAACQQCKKERLNVTQMATITDTGVIRNVMDLVCKKCRAEHARDLQRIARVVCVGCREVVLAVEPGREKAGFVWKEGGFYHVAECPRCTSRFDLERSHIAEKIWFYKKNGIPYE